MATREIEKPHWERVLYRTMNVPDNYCDETQFLKQLRKNETVVRYTLSESICGACIVMGHINLIIIYLCTFEYVQLEKITCLELAIIVSALVFLCANIYLFLNAKSLSRDRVVDHARTFFTLLLFGYGFTPIIRTLTTSISTDTIYAVSFGLFSISLVFHNYGLEAPIVSQTFSANLSLAASVFLISRVQTDQQAFCLLTFSLCAFCFWPRLRNIIIWQSSHSVHILFVILAPLAIWLVNTISISLAVIHFLGHIFIVLICPILLVGMQHYKSTIHGPWDEANVKGLVN